MIPLEALRENVFRLLARDWMLITAGKGTRFNTMTASWGGFGVLWNRPLAIVFVRPTRYTFEFLEQTPRFTLSFLEHRRYRRALTICGTKSGRELDKVKAAGITPVGFGPNAIAFAEARMVFICRKLYWQDLEPGHFLVPTLARFYPEYDYHRMYFGAVVKCLRRDASR
ncbi:MAG: flavin reductase [candidate division WOR-3 bacterium]